MMLTDFASLPLDELQAELERMIRIHHRPRVEYASRMATNSPPPAGPSRDAAANLPLDRAGAGDPFTVTRSGTGDPSPVDAAVRGDLLELPA